MKQTIANNLEARPTKKRWFILLLVCLITFVNYLDRANLAVAAPFLSKDLALNAAMMGIIFSAMSWSYTVMQIPSGMVSNHHSYFSCFRFPQHDCV